MGTGTLRINLLLKPESPMGSLRSICHPAGPIPETVQGGSSKTGLDGIKRGGAHRLSQKLSLDFDARGNT